MSFGHQRFSLFHPLRCAKQLGPGATWSSERISFVTTAEIPHEPLLTDDNIHLKRRREYPIFAARSCGSFRGGNDLLSNKQTSAKGMQRLLDSGIFFFAMACSTRICLFPDMARGL
jgi:hypothetical protein